MKVSFYQIFWPVFPVMLSFHCAASKWYLWNAFTSHSICVILHNMRTRGEIGNQRKSESAHRNTLYQLEAIFIVVANSMYEERVLWEIFRNIYVKLQKCYSVNSIGDSKMCYWTLVSCLLCLEYFILNINLINNLRKTFIHTAIKACFKSYTKYVQIAFLNIYSHQ